MAFPQKRNPTRCAAEEQSPLRSKSGSSKRVAGFFVCAPLLLLSKSNPLRWASIWFFVLRPAGGSGFIQRNPRLRVGEICFACEIWLRHVKCLRAWVDFISLSAPAEYITSAPALISHFAPAKYFTNTPSPTHKKPPHGDTMRRPLILHFCVCRGIR